MSSRTRSSSRLAARLTLVALLVCCGSWSAGCGHKKAPKPPPSKLPQRAAITAHQRGSECVLELPYPTVTISGTPLEGISGIEVLRFAMEVPEFAIELLAEEAAARKEAQELLDELGLELYDVPAGTPPEGAVDAFGNPLPSTETPESPYGTDTASSEQATPEAPAAPPLEEESPEAATGDEVEAGDSEPPSTEGDDAPVDDAGDEAAADAEAPGGGDEISSEEDGEDGGEGEESVEAEEGEEGEETQLTEEEQLALKIEAARNTLRSPPTSKSTFIAATAKDFKQGSEVVLVVEADDIGSVVVGDQIVLRVPLPARPEEGPEIGYLFGVKLFALNGKPSDLSNTVALLPEDVPPAPRDVTVEAQAQGIMLTWSADEEPEGGFRVYRRDAQSRTYGKPVGTLPGTFTTWFDRQAVFGARYIYGVTALASTTPLLESEISSEHEVDYQDRFGPTIPAGLVAFPEAGRVRLLWTPVVDPDLAGYEIRRRRDGAEEEPALLTEELVTRSQYLDQTVATGQTWLYSVVAVDQLGNRSDPSLEVQVRVP